MGEVDTRIRNRLAVHNAGLGTVSIFSQQKQSDQGAAGISELDHLFHLCIICLEIRCLRESNNWPGSATYLPMGLGERPSGTPLASTTGEQASGFGCHPIKMAKNREK